MLGIYSPISVVPFFQLHFKSFAADPLISRYQILQLYHCKSKVKFLGIIQVIFFCNEHYTHTEFEVRILYIFRMLKVFSPYFLQAK